MKGLQSDNKQQQYFDVYLKLHVAVMNINYQTNYLLLLSQSVSQSVRQAVSQSDSQSVRQSDSQSVSQSVSQPVSQSVSQSIGRKRFLVLLVLSFKSFLTKRMVSAALKP